MMIIENSNQSLFFVDIADAKQKGYIPKQYTAVYDSAKGTTVYLCFLENPNLEYLESVKPQ